VKGRCAGDDVVIGVVEGDVASKHRIALCRDFPSSCRDRCTRRRARPSHWSCWTLSAADFNEIVTMATGGRRVCAGWVGFGVLVRLDLSLDSEPKLAYNAVRGFGKSLQFERLADGKKRDLNGASSDLMLVVRLSTDFMSKHSPARHRGSRQGVDGREHGR
jgi:hypothetical protein